MELLSFALVLIILGFIVKLSSKNNEIEALKEKLHSDMHLSSDELYETARKKLETDGTVKTVKYVREETGMGLVAAKQFVDRLDADKS